MDVLVGGSASDLLNQAVSQRRHARVTALETRYSFLAVLSSIESHKGSQYVILICSGGKAFPLRSLADHKLLLEFDDSQRVKCCFNAELSKAGDHEIWVSKPDRITRMQRRQYVRVSVPSGCHMTAKVHGEPAIFFIKDLSLGGMATVVHSGSRARVLLNNGDELKEIRLTLPAGRETIQIDISSARVVRTQNDVRLGVTVYGVQFQDLGRSVEHRLSSYILHCEREAIRRLKELE